MIDLICDVITRSSLAVSEAALQVKSLYMTKSWYKSRKQEKIWKS